MRPKRIVITGATSGIGAALASAYAADGVSLLLMGRDVTRMTHVVSAAEAAGALVTPALLDMRDERAMAAALTDFETGGGIDLLILAAGVKTGNRTGCEPPEQMKRVLDVNLAASVLSVQQVLPGMQRRGQGQIALFSSLAALSPHADLLSYSASKAGLRAYGTALRRALRGSGVNVSVIMPGFVDTPMTDRQLGPRPLMISPQRAAKIIRNGLLRRRAYIGFPWLLLLLVRLENLLPVFLRDRIDAGYRADILPDQEEARQNRD